jgi:hypothetical protein
LLARSSTWVKLSSIEFSASATFPKVSLVALARSVRSPWATWLMTVRNWLMLFCSVPCTSGVGAAEAVTLAAARRKFSTMAANSSWLSSCT